MDPILVPSLVYLGWSLAERYRHVSPKGFERPAESPLSWAAGVTVGILAGIVLHGAMKLASLGRGVDRPSELTLSLLGGRWEPGAGNERMAWRCAVAGPLTWLVLALLTWVVTRHGPRLPSEGELPLRDLWRYQLIAGMIHLLPARPFDGGAILFGLALPRLGLRVTWHVARAIGWLLALACIFLAFAYRAVAFLVIAVFLFAASEEEPAHHS